VAKHLALDFGVVALPSTFFAAADGEGLSAEGAECIRFSVANVTDEKVKLLGERLKVIEKDLAMKVSQN
jgi:DNA-binding transcriptional MocR family regulator